MKSLQTRLLVGVTTVFASGFLLASTAIYVVSQATMYAEFDAALYATAQALANLTEETERGIELEVSEGFEEFSRDDAPGYYQFWLDGKVLAKSKHLENRNLKLGRGTRDVPQYRTVALPDGRPGRQVCFTFQPSIDDWVEEDDDWEEEYTQRDQRTQDVTASLVAQRVALGEHAATAPAESGVLTLTWEAARADVTIALARSTTQLDQRLANLLWILPSVGTAITLLGSVVLASVVRNGLQPVKTIAAAITDIDENSLEDRVSMDRVPVEVLPIVRRLNDLLSRLEIAFHRERAFSSNLAHELRTPLAGLRATLEVHRAQAHHVERCARTVDTCLEICDQSESLVENLLTLARVEAVTFACNVEPIRIDDLFRECWQPFAAQANRKHLRTSLDIPQILVATDREGLRVILQNVLSNAVCHSDPGGCIDVKVLSTDDQLSISVLNSGNQLDAHQAEVAFDRLWRGDHARSQTGEHFGLGLTIIKRFTEALGGHVDLCLDASFRITISLPV